VASSKDTEKITATEGNDYTENLSSNPENSAIVKREKPKRRTLRQTLTLVKKEKQRLQRKKPYSKEREGPTESLAHGLS